MTNDFLQDKEFLLKVNRYKHRVYYAKITILDFETEKPVASFEGKVTGGSMSVSASSNTRRTGSLSVVFDDTTKNITDVTNLIAIDKKVDIKIGISNPFNITPEYSKYGDVLWFKQGIFIITQASSTISTTAASVSVNFIDKMGMLNGTCGGTFPASTNLHEILVIDKDGNQSYEYPLIKDIIIEVVHHYGGEARSRIMVEDLEEVGRQTVKWDGTSPVWFQKQGTTPNGNFIVSQSDPDPNGGTYEEFIKGETVGYLETPLTYPGELIMNAGNKVTDALDQIKNTLGNYEYYYDVDGIFHFRKIKNFVATGNTPLNLYMDYRDEQGALHDNGDTSFQSMYAPIYTDDIYINEFLDNELISQVSFSPNYSNIKNDFVCWGSGGETTTTSSGTSGSGSANSSWVRYHLAIDKRPTDIKAPTTKDINDPTITQEEKDYKLWVGDNFSLCHKSIYSIANEDEPEVVIRYQTTASTNPKEIATLIARPLEDTREGGLEDETGALIFTSPEAQFNWREELYRQALIAWGSSVEGSYYDEELLAEWRKLFDPYNMDFYDDWKLEINSAWYGYNPDILFAPDKINYWLDIIDINSSVGKYSVNRIGRRTVVSNNTKIHEVFQQEVPDIVFIENTYNVSDDERKALAEKIAYYISIGQRYCLVNSDQLQYLQTINNLGSCYEDARSALYSGIVYNSSVNLTCIPIFYLDVNQLVQLNKPDLGIKGNYVINQISFQIGRTQTMTVSLQEAIVTA